MSVRTPLTVLACYGSLLTATYHGYSDLELLRGFQEEAQAKQEGRLQQEGQAEAATAALPGRQ